MNPGKRFEQDFKASVGDDLYAFRLRDCGGWSKDDATRFTPRNPFDFFLFADTLGVLMALELKSTGGTSIRFDELTKGQVSGLDLAHAGGCLAGVLVEWRKDDHEVFYVPIENWLQEEDTNPKKSMNRAECRKIGLTVMGDKKITRYTYDLWMLAHTARFDRKEKE